MTQKFEPGFQLCTLVSKARGEMPIGSASTFEHCLVMELAPPWPKDALQAAHVPAGLRDVLARAAARGLKVRPLAIIPDPEYSQEGFTRLIRYQRPPTQFSKYHKVEYLAPDAQVVDLAEALFENGNALNHFAAYCQETDDVRDLLVCTHGTRDTCCGTFGFPIYQALRQQYASASAGKLRVWRTSHTGGHRFAPTLVDFPDGHYWGRIDLEILDLLVQRHKSVTELQPYYRGSSALSRLEQVAERDIWAREGWPWLEYLKTSRIISIDEAAELATIEVSFSSADGAVRGCYEATVEQYDTVVTLASSGNEKWREEPLYRVSQLHKRT